MKSARIAIFASGAGSNAERIIQYFKDHPTMQVAGVFSNKSTAGVIDIAREQQIPVFIFSREELYETSKVLDDLEQIHATHVVLAGFLWLMPSSILHAYANRVVNIHPALLPDFGGKGMYGMHVHKAVLESGKKETGITIHLVNENYDEGEYLAQYKIQLTGAETAEEIAQKVQQVEHAHFAPEIEKWINTTF